jgi:hypothetical protein
MSDAAAERMTDPVDVAALLLGAPASSTRAGLLAEAVVEAIADSACVVYRFDPQADEGAWRVAGFGGDISVSQGALPSDDLLAPLLGESQDSVIYVGADLEREDYAHLQVARSVASIAYLPLVNEGQLAGAVEVLTFSEAVSAGDLEALEPLLRVGTPALLGAENFEQQRQELLDSVRRLTQLYDLEKSLNDPRSGPRDGADSAQGAADAGVPGRASVAV